MKKGAPIYGAGGEVIGHHSAAHCGHDHGDVSEPSSQEVQMHVDRASSIVGAICDRLFFEMGFDQGMGSLEGVTLAEMLKAAELMKGENRRRSQHQRLHGGTITLSVIPGEAQIAAVFCLENLDAKRKGIASHPISPQGRKVVAVLNLPMGEMS